MKGRKRGPRERWAGLSWSLFSAPEEKKGAGGGGGPVRLRSMSRKDSISEDEMVLRERSYDYQFRYCGHCNTTTDIKEANFFGRSEALKRSGGPSLVRGRRLRVAWGLRLSEVSNPSSVPLGRWLHLCEPPSPPALLYR